MIDKIKFVQQRASLYLKFFGSNIGRKVRPVVTDLFITTRCNSKCRYCYTDKTISMPQELDTGQWKRIIDELHALGCRMFNLMGGEPLLRQDMPELLRHIMAKNVICDVNTNCYLAPEFLPELKLATQIFTSLDGDEKAHDLNRGKGTFKKTMKGIVAARSAGIPMRINCTVTRHNVDCVDFLVRVCDEHNLFLTFTPLIRIRDVLLPGAEDLTMTDEESREAFKKIKSAKRHTNRIMNSDASLDFFINYPVQLGTMVMRNETGPQADYYSKPCPYGRLQHFIAPQGDVFPCHNMWNEPRFVPKNVIGHGTAEAIANASRLPCKYCWLANLVEWNEFITPSWLAKGLYMTAMQLFGRGKRS